MHTLLAHLQTDLGSDHAASRLHTQLWNSQGHPTPFLHEQNAHMTLELLQLGGLAQLKAKDVADSNKVSFTLHQRADFLKQLAGSLSALLKRPLEPLDPGRERKLCVHSRAIDFHSLTPTNIFLSFSFMACTMASNIGTVLDML